GLHLFWSSVFGAFELQNYILRRMNAAQAHNGVVDFLVSPITLLIALYLVSGVTHLFLLMMRGAKHGFATTSRVFAFSYSPQLFTVVPVLGGLVAFFWMITLAIIGLREAHETDGAKAAVAVLVPLFLL